MEKTALVLAGGGAKGAYQAKVAQRIFDEIEIDAITGISVGALNGSILSQNSPDELISIWKNIRKSDVWAGGHGPIRYFKLAFGYSLGLYDPSPLRKTLSENYTPNATEIPFRTGAVNFETGEYESLQVRTDKLYEEKEVKRIRDFITASSAIPVAVEPHEVGGTPMADGGIRNMAPIEDALKFEPDRIIAVLNSNQDFSSPLQHVADAAERAVETVLDETIRNDIRTAKAINELLKTQDVEGYSRVPIDVIRPSEPIGSPTDFSKPEKRFEVGKKDANKYLVQKG